MPQLDTAWFASQIFWLIITFGIMYFLLSRSYLPRVRNILQERRTKIQNDIDEAEKLKSQAEKIRAEYEELARKSREGFSEIINSELSKARDEFAKKMADNDRQIAEMLSKAEEEISKELKEAIVKSEKQIQDIVAGVLKKTSDTRVEEAKISLAVNNVSKNVKPGAGY